MTDQLPYSNQVVWGLGHNNALVDDASLSRLDRDMEC